ncbi:Lipopolysaccharide biosynthesis protein, LPS:glycosyltransferase [Propionispira arboris]|uniref:Lipopolysaccharide biosynthesis protein, LPS:glycosyltransferase n=1 Tax=Propionispira arboris TaxID=84035 RepID=A0A1H7CL24_9FIRM|nr:glycosyltransferase family 8 protein [Propionispira arboris]SEJ87812.1 Lipopolysaccharide biosynthesis protein, LPS:glycosyltransferase [Propionispira arboris]
MIHVCFPIHDKNGTYAKYLGTAIYSLLKNTKEKVMIHLLHDDTFRLEDKKKLVDMVKAFSQDIKFYCISIDDVIQRLDGTARWYYTVGTFFRLYILKTVPSVIEKIIYLDADVVVHLDIKQLWDIPFQDAAIIAAHDVHIQSFKSYPLFDNACLSADKYFNAGVLVLNCNLIREKFNLLNNSINFFVEHYEEILSADQDALNYVFKTSCRFVDNIYNLSVKHERELGKIKIKPAIYHYINRSYGSEQVDEYDQLYYQYLLESPWGDVEFGMNCLLNMHSDLYALQKQLRKQKCMFVRSKKVIYFGASGVLLQAILKEIPRQLSDYFVDNDSDKWGEIVAEMPVCDPQKICTEQRNSIVIIIVSLQYTTIKRQLEFYGYQENRDFFYGEDLLSAENGGKKYNMFLSFDKKTKGGNIWRYR